MNVSGTARGAPERSKIGLRDPGVFGDMGDPDILGRVPEGVIVVTEDSEGTCGC